ncbi:hypothetical protein HY085_01640 [Candidatus Gottesmanbacteria bacterium]|nr:hypothetical protein [Candidatus Gottesmanbacteria bacterium]
MLIDVDADPTLAQKYGVMSIPTLILLKNDQPVKQWVGYQSKENLMAGLQPFLAV